MNLRDSYDAAADAYAEHLYTELDHKPLDRHLLNRFAEGVSDKGEVADLGSGPGHVAKYLHDRGVSVIGVDLAPGMVNTARRLAPEVAFRVGDMLALDFAEGSLAGLVAFYSIVHFDAGELGMVFAEMRRVVRGGGLVLIAFHIGDQQVHVDDLFGVAVSLDFTFHPPSRVVDILGEAGFRVIERVEREPYEGAEYPSRRCYLLAVAKPELA